MQSKKQQIGNKGEQEAEDFLIKKGYRILDRNYRVKNIGELDLVSEKNGKIIFVEVKTRSNTHEINFPIQLSINPRKKRILKKMCEIYLMTKKELTNKQWQVDGIFITFDILKGNQSKIDHIENILWDKYY